MSHTSGPWETRPWFDGKACVVKTDGDGVAVLVVAKVEDTCDSPDARLISAAPELLKAAEQALRFISNGIEYGYITLPEPGDPALEVPAILRAAIANARGESHAPAP